MRILESSHHCIVPAGVKVSVKGRTVRVEGKRGALTRDFNHLSVDIKVVGDKVVVTKFFGNKKQLAAVRTVISHIKNLIKGVTYGFRYKMKTVYAHFPINLSIPTGGKQIEVRNFLGEKFNRVIIMKPGVTVAATGQKDEIQLDGNNVEDVSKCAALIRQSVKVRNKDIRKFLDGIYVSETGTIDPME